MSFVKEFTVGTKTKRSKEDLKRAEELREKARDEDSKMVTGIFKNIEVPGGDLTFTYKKYKEDNYRTYHFYDGMKYTIPLGVAKHLNNQTAQNKREYGKNPDGSPTLYTIIGSKRQRYQFLSTEYM